MIKANSKQQVWLMFTFLILFYLGVILWKVIEQDFTGLVVASLFSIGFIFWYLWFVTFRYAPLIKKLGQLEGAVAVLKRDKKMLESILKFVKGAEEKWKKRKK